MRIYLDACCLNRPFDDQAQDRIRLESEAILLILSHCEDGHWHWLGSDVLNLEIAQTPDAARRIRVELLLHSASEHITVGDEEARRAMELQQEGFHAFDALHLAAAESARADIFLTTDDRLARLAARLTNQLRVRVANPLLWLQEVMTP